MTSMKFEKLFYLIVPLLPGSGSFYFLPSI
nr:MAG TPA: hypothetical protein [Caudoviricetes sp.]